MSKLGRLAERLRPRAGRGRGRAVRKRSAAGSAYDEQLVSTPLSASLFKNKASLRRALGDSFDLTFRGLQPDPESRKLLLVYLRGSTNESLIAESVLKPLSQSGFPKEGTPQAVFAALRDRLIQAGTIREAETLEDLLDGVLRAEAAILVDGLPGALLVVVPDWPTRGVEEPITEANIRGSRDGFGSVVIDNVALLRRLVRDPALRFERRHVGRRTKTPVVVAYIDGLAPRSLVEEIGRRLAGIQVDGVLESGMVEELIRDHRWTPFPMLLRTERPDRVAAGLLEGRAAVLVEGSQFALIAPVVLASFIDAPDDWYQGFILGTVLRLLRYSGFVLSLVLPALYVATTSFHQEMIPTDLAMSIARQRQGIPVPVVAEALLLQVTFELLREAGLRLPTPLGQAVTIVGALIIGQQAVEAGLVSPILLMIIAITAIASFVTPIYSMSVAIRLLNPFLVILGGTLGLFGVVNGLFGLGVHLSSLNSFGVPYMTPLAPTRREGLKDTLFRWPLWGQKRRPDLAPGATSARPQASASAGEGRHKGQDAHHDWGAGW